ncbi:hypothetical protein TPA0908_20400 [Micromonospora sp. AKA38]|nr:hypothetical protein TPA0908_20400 [Micromonospora sp. AKA38]
MLRFAASRAATSPVDRAVPRGRLWRTAGVLLLAPPAGLVALARRGRTRTAWLVGVLGALVAADAPVARTVVAAIPATAPAVADLPPDAVDRVSAPLWLFTCWTDSSFGLPRPTAWERFLITDRVVVEPMFSGARRGTRLTPGGIPRGSSAVPPRNGPDQV